MKLGYSTKAKDPVYYVQRSFRDRKNGNKATTVNVYTIGKHSELLKITDDPLAYAKQVVAEFNEKDKEERASQIQTLNLTIDYKKLLEYDECADALERHVPSSFNVNIGYFFIQKILQSLNLNELIDKLQAKTRTKFDASKITRFLVYDRMMFPRSKNSLYENRKIYYENPQFQYQHILRTMDILDDNFDEIVIHLYNNSEKIVKRDTSVCYFDFTNIYFENEYEDIDYIDSVTGEIIHGLRNYGLSKENRPNPIVQIGLITDANGIPLMITVRPGQENEKKSILSMEERLVKMFEGKPFIYCSDSGLNPYYMRDYNSYCGRGFVVTQSIKKLPQTLQEAVFSDIDYRRLSNNDKASLDYMQTFDINDSRNDELYNDRVYKIIRTSREVDIGLRKEKIYKNGNVREVKDKCYAKENLIITFSRKSREYQRYVRNRQIERAKDMISGKIDIESRTKGPNDATRFIKNVNKKGAAKYVIDEELIAEEEKYDGFYAIATNLDDDVKTILHINEMRYQVEDCFRTMKTHFDIRPVYHSLPKRIRAHCLICFIALLIYRLMEYILNVDKKKQRKSKKNMRKVPAPADPEEKKEEIARTRAYTVDEIVETLRNMTVRLQYDQYYEAGYSSSDIVTDLCKFFELPLNRRYYKYKELDKIMKEMLK